MKKIAGVSIWIWLVGVTMLVCNLTSSCAEKEKPPTMHSQRISLSESSAPTNPQGNFSKGDGKIRVKSVMGEPDYINSRLSGEEEWGYKFSSITFRKGRVVKWNDFSGVLRCSGKNMGYGEEDQGSEQLAGSVDFKGESTMPSGFSGVSPFSQKGGGRYINPDQIQVREHTRSDGKVVGPYIRTRGNSTNSDNLRKR